MKVLVIYDLIPEETIKKVVEMTNEEYEYFKTSNNFFVNGDREDENPIGFEANMVISNALSENPEHIEYCDTDKQREYFGKWSSKEMDVLEDISDVKRLINCGFIL